MSRFPIVVLTCPRVLGPTAVEELRAGYAKLTARRERFVVITDTTLIAEVPSALVRKQLAAILNEPEFASEMRRYQVGAGLVVDSVVIRGALTALLWLWTPPAPIHHARTLAEALSWAEAKMRDAGGTVSTNQRP